VAAAIEPVRVTVVPDLEADKVNGAVPLAEILPTPPKLESE